MANARFLSLAILCSACLSIVARAADEAPRLELKPGDRIALIGNTLAERMQHEGNLETLLQGRFPKHELAIRNLGFSGDELTQRLRSAGFGSPDDHLSHSQTDVVLAFFGYNESFAGPEGLEKFKQDLAAFIKHTREQKYNGAFAPKLVVFSPIAFEDLGDPNLPDGREINARLAQYTHAMAEVAKAHDVLFVDLFHPTQKLYEADVRPLTINGVHLNEHGDAEIAKLIDQALFGENKSPLAKEAYAAVRQAVLDKNFHWFNRYRTTDGYSIFGGRADLKFVNDQTNRVVMQRELEVLDVMTANRDKKIWAAAQGKTLAVDDSNTPPFIDVITNKPGPLPGGKHVFLGGEESVGKMTVAKNMKVTLVASEEMFPEMVNPVQMAFDTKSRLWVACWESYPHWKPKDKLSDKLLILEDTNGDGRADKCTTFIDDLHNPTGFEFWGGGVFVGTAPDLLFLKDTDGDDKADVRQRVLHGLDSADTHHGSNSFALDPGGALYFQEGTFHHSQIESPYAPSLRLANAGVFRYEPRTQKIGVYVSHGFANPHGHAFDDWGQDIIVDGTGANPYHGALFSGHIEFPAKHPTPPGVYKPRTRPCPGIEYVSAGHFPAEMVGNLLVGNVIGFQGILQYKVNDKGASFGADELEPILSSSDPNFRPTDFEFGPDGALYFADWQNPIIGHMQHNLRDPSRDRTHGRVYRVTHEGRPLVTPVPVAGEPIAKLLDLLKGNEARVRFRARIELSGRPTADVLAEVKSWLTKLDKKDPNFEHHQLEALWLHQQHNDVDVALLDRVLASPDFRARAAATRVLCYQQDRVPGALDKLRKLAADEHPRVRLEAVRSASFMTVPEAVEVPVIAAQAPQDEFLTYVRGETMKTLDRHWKKAIDEGRDIALTTDAGKQFWLHELKNDQLLKLAKTRDVCIEILKRPGLLDEDRRKAVSTLAQLEQKSEIAVIIAAVQSLDASPTEVTPSLVFDLVRQLTSRNATELGTARAELEKMATSARQPLLRQVGFVSLMNVDKSPEPAWKLAQSSVGSLRDFVDAIPLVADGSLRASLYPRIEPLIKGLPAPLAQDKAPKGLSGRFVRIELPKKGTLTLAEVEVLSGGNNIARNGRATQKNVSNGGDASKAIDGNKNGQFGAGGQTHTEENTSNPWWEVDLGADRPIESIVIYNRTEGYLGKRLNNFTLTVLDANRKPVFTQEGVEAPREQLTVTISDGDPAAAVRQAAMLALTSVRGQEAKTFELLAPIVADDRDRAAAIHALKRIDRGAWPKEAAQKLLKEVVSYIRLVPVAERTSPEPLAALELAHALTSAFPPNEAKQLRSELDELGVRVVRVGTLFERMSYDQDVIAVRAGKPVEFVFENSDLMPHNFVIVRPGTLTEIGESAEATAQQPDSAARNYVPKSNNVLLASTLLQPRGSEKLSFTAPNEPGIYPYVCTYPGHWRRMYGALYVVEDLDSYLENPEAYLAAHPLQVKDPQLADRRPRTEWKLDDLAAVVGQLEHGRSFGNGKQIFQVASCVACHKLDGAGTVIGPDLAKLDEKFHAMDILKELLEPSARINEKFQTYTFELDNGKVVTGLVLEETPSKIKVIENPLLKADPVEIAPGDIVQRVKSTSSIMPKGLLDKLSREEILDLIAFVIARGNAEHKVFSGGGHGEH